MRAARAIVGNQFDAEDVVQTSCLRALEHRDRLKTHDNLRGWLNTIMRHSVVDLWRQQNRMVPLERVAEPATDEPAPPSAWSAFETRDVLEALTKCSPALRSVYELQVLQGLSGQETARRLGISVSTVATRVFRARNRLRQILTDGAGAPAIST